MATPPRTLGKGAANAPGNEPRKTYHTTVAEAEDRFDRDLHEDDRAGQHGGALPRREYTAFDVKALHETMPDFTNDELKRIPILAHGERLEQGGIYLDLSDRAQGVFVAQGSLEAQDPHLYVPKADCDFAIWDKLTGVHH